MTVGATSGEGVRTAMFDHLDRLVAQSPSGAVRSAEINTFVYDGRAIPLIVQQGIYKPAGMDAALTIRTTYTPPDAMPPYHDELGTEGLVRYKYRGVDPNHSDNRALRTAMTQSLPLAYFVGVDRGMYLPRYPVWLIAEDAGRHEFTVAVDEGQLLFAGELLDAPQREYVKRLTNMRLHQPVFRARVLRAYGEVCAMCRLRHSSLLDAAHILPDIHPNGDPVVPNGLSLCKIHHAAYDQNILGVRPDLVIEARPDILAEIDGPMLRHGLQEMAGLQITIPRTRREQPDPLRLEERYEEFRKAG